MKIKILLVCFTILAFSCENDNEIVAPKTNQNSILVSSEKARAIALKFAQNNFQLTKPQDATSSTPFEKIKNEDVIAGSNNNPYFYAFNLEKGGFVIVSAEKNEHPILAYSDKGEFTRKDAPYGIHLWIETTKENIDYIRQGKFNTKLAAVEWSRIEKDVPVSSTPFQKIAPPDPGCQETSTTTVVGPLLATTWDQGCGYNAYCPLATGGPCGRAWTGCVATAMAQVMRFWHKTTMYNWAIMPNTTSNDEVARLMSDAGTTVHMQYGADGSGAKHEDIPGALVNTFGFTSAQNIDYGLSSYSTVQNNLYYHRPVILSGYNVKNSSWFGLVVSYQQGHEWVCDGYNETSYTWCNDDGSFGGGATYLYFHMNWGWGGSSNGWFGFDNWAPTGSGYNFQYYRRAIVNIY